MQYPLGIPPEALQFELVAHHCGATYFCAYDKTTCDAMPSLTNKEYAKVLKKRMKKNA